MFTPLFLKPIPCILNGDKGVVLVLIFSLRTPRWYLGISQDDYSPHLFGTGSMYEIILTDP